MASKGYFSIFKESSDLILTSIRHGLPLGIYRDWFENVYLPEKYPAYLQGK